MQGNRARDLQLARSRLEERRCDEMDDFEKRWERIQEQLRIQARGDVQPRFSSTRTLFGIRSEVEQKMDEIAREFEEDNKAKRQAAEVDGEQPE